MVQEHAPIFFILFFFLSSVLSFCPTLPSAMYHLFNSFFPYSVSFVELFYLVCLLFPVSLSPPLFIHLFIYSFLSPLFCPLYIFAFLNEFLFSVLLYVQLCFSPFLASQLTILSIHSHLSSPFSTPLLSSPLLFSPPTLLSFSRLLLRFILSSFILPSFIHQCSLSPLVSCPESRGAGGGGERDSGPERRSSRGHGRGHSAHAAAAHVPSAASTAQQPLLPDEPRLLGLASGLQQD